VKVFYWETDRESKSGELLQKGGDPEIGSALTSFEISLFKILSLKDTKWWLR
jgi:hypothetical protein